MTSTHDTATTTAVIIEEECKEEKVLILRLKKPESKLKWSEDTIDNEFMNKKNSKRCCIFHKTRKFAESDSESSDEESSKNEKQRNMTRFHA